MNPKILLFFALMLFINKHAHSQLKTKEEKFSRCLTKKIKRYIKEGYPKTIRYCPVDKDWCTPLPYHFTSPCIVGFRNQFYWDSYFTNLGLLRMGKLDSLAINNVNNLLYQVEQHGFVPNFNRKSGSNRSQQPYLSMMVRDIYEHLQDIEWLKEAYELLKIEYEFWMTQRITAVGLNHFSNDASPKEIQEFYSMLKTYRFPDLEMDSLEQLEFASQAISEAESSWDFTPRFDRRCADFCGIDLNSNLYIYETNFIYFSQLLQNGEDTLWQKRAEQRKELINKYLWNDALGCFVDYDWKYEKQSTEITAAMFNALWAKIASKEQALKTVKAMQAIEFEYGISPCENKTRNYTYQWDYPNAWPPLQFIAVMGLDNYEFKEDATRIARKYVNNVKRNYKTTKHLWEKYNVAEGNIEVKDEYEMPSMLGWTAGVFMYLSKYLGE